MIVRAQFRSFVSVIAGTALLCASATSPAQQAPLDLPPGTRVRSVDFRYVHSRTIDGDELREHIATGAPAPVGLFGKLFGFLFGTDTPPLPDFEPLELERDAVRIQRYYDRSGMLHTDVGFEVHPDTAARRVDVALVIDEGKPTLLRTVRIEAGDSTHVDSAVALPPDVVRAAHQAVAPARNHRFGSSEASTAERRTRLYAIRICSQPRSQRRIRTPHRSQYAKSKWAEPNSSAIHPLHSAV